MRQRSILFLEKIMQTWSIRKKLIFLVAVILIPGVGITIYDSFSNFVSGWFGIAFVGVSAIIAVMLATLFGDIAFKQPIERIIKVTQRFGAGLLGVRTGVLYSDDELGKLAASFDSMAELLEQRELDKLDLEKRLIIALRENERILNTVEEGIIGIDKFGLVTFTNRAACVLLGYGDDELIGKDLHRTIHHSYIDGAPYSLTDCPMWKCLKKGECTRIRDEVLWKKDKSSLPVAYSTSPIIENEQVIGAVISFRDITIRKRAQEEIQRSHELISMRLELIEYSIDCTLDEFLVKILDEISLYLKSPIAFYHFVAPDQKSLALQQWSTKTLKEFCRADGKGTHYDIEKAGVWIDCIKQKKPVIHNHYAFLEHKKGLPEGHVPIIRELVAPVIRRGKVVAVFGIGNKFTEYTETDAETLSYFADVTWEIVSRKKAEIALSDIQK